MENLSSRPGDFKRYADKSASFAMETIASIEDICELVRDGFTDWARQGHVEVKSKNDLLLFNYTHAAQVAGRWNQFERLSRGLIIHNRTGAVVARSFDKFFNWNEEGRCSDAALRLVTEKMDGVLGVLYRDGGYSVATRGAFDSPQALWATKCLHDNHNLQNLHDEWTLIFEIISPDHRLVVDYGDTSALVLLAVRNRLSGVFLAFEEVQVVAEQHGFPIPNVYSFETVSEILDHKRVIDGTQEGWVAEFADGQRFKFKGDRYLELHKLAAELSFKTALNAVAANTVDTVRQTIPEEFITEFDAWVDKVRQVENDTKKKVEHVLQTAPDTNRKEFATWVMDNHSELAAYLFASVDGKVIDEIIYKREFRAQ